MDSIFRHLVTSRTQLLALYGLWVLLVMLGAYGLATSETYQLDMSESDTLPTIIGLLVATVLVHFVSVYGTGPLAADGFLHALDQRWTHGVLRGWPRLVAIGRWLLVVPALAAQAALQIGVLGFSYLALAARIGENVTAKRSLSDGFLEALDLGVGLLGAGFVVSALIFMVIAWRYPRVRALFFGHLLVAAIALYGLFVLAATLYLNMVVFQGGKGDLLWWLLFPAVQLVLSIGALLRLCFGKTLALPCEQSVAALPAQTAAFDGTSSLSSARVLATAMLAVSYVAIDVSSELASDMGRLGQVRSLAAAMVSMELSAAGPEAKSDGVNHYPMGHAKRVQSRSDGGFFRSSRAEIIEVTSPEGKVWRARPTTIEFADKAAKDADLPHPEQLTPVVVAKRNAKIKQEIIGRLAVMARPLGLKLDTKNARFYDMFAEVERKLTDVKQVSIPLIGLQVRAGYAAWILSVTAFLLLVLIRSRVHRVFYDQTLAVAEPWLILDAGRFWERTTAYVWLAVLLSAALITHLGVLVIMGAQIPAEGGVTSAAYDLTAFGATFVIFVVASLVAIDVARHLLTLRRLRDIEGVGGDSPAVEA